MIFMISAWIKSSDDRCYSSEDEMKFDNMTHQHIK